MWQGACFAIKSRQIALFGKYKPVNNILDAVFR